MDSYVFNLIILSREGILFQKDVLSISSYNTSGKFDILAHHANFISLIKDQIVVRDKDGIETRFKISNALIKVIQNNVKIYLGIDWFIASEQQRISL